MFKGGNKMSFQNPKILVIGPAWVGDMVMAQTLFILLKQQNPNAIIDVLAPAWSAPLLARMPEINQFLVLPFKHGELKLWERYKLAKQLRNNHYDLAYVLPNSFKSALIPLWAKIPRRVGWRGEMRWGLLNDIRYLDKQKLPLMIERFMALALPPLSALTKPYPKPALRISENERNQALIKHQLTLSEKPILALCPGAEFGPAKRWPAEYYAEVARKKIAEGWQVWIFGSPKDQQEATIIQQETNNACFDLTGKTSLAEAIDLLSLANLVITNDSGLMHIAAALERPLVVLYGSSDPRFTPPLSDNVKILNLQLSCSPCFERTCPLQHQKCLRDLHAPMVFEAIKELGI